MRWILLYLCVFAQTCAAPSEEQGTNSDISQHLKKKDDGHDFRKQPKEHAHLQEVYEVHDSTLENKNEILRIDAQQTIHNHQRKSEDAKENLALAKGHQNSVAFYVDSADFEKSYPGSSHEIVHKNVVDSPNIEDQGIRRKSPKLNTSLELIFQESQVTANEVTSNKKTAVEHGRITPEHFSPISTSVLGIPEKDGNTAPDNKSAAYYFGVNKGANKAIVGHRGMEGNDNAVSGIEGQDAGMSSGSGDYYTEETTSTDRGVLVQLHSTNMGRENGSLNSTATTIVSTGHTKTLDSREEGNRNNHHEQLGASDAEASVKQKHSGCHNNAKGMDNRKNTRCNKFVVVNKTSVCIEFANSRSIKQIMVLPNACKNMSHKVEASGKAKNVDAQTLHYSKGTPILKNHGSHSQNKHERNDKFRNSRQIRDGKIYQSIGKRSRQMNFPKHVKMSKIKVTHVKRNDDSTSSSESSSESGQSRSDSGQSK